jgi:very-short-patch-repair endonuclease
MDIKEYYIKQISRTNKKNYENYVVCRILNRLNDISIKFITQQPVIFKDIKRKALTDLYFPQIDLHIEIDEPYHKRQTEDDIKREADIITITNHDIRRIDASQSLKLIHQNIDKILDEIKKNIQKKKDDGEFISWDIEEEFNPQFYINKGYIDLKDKVAFRTAVDACNCFGHNYKHGGVWKGAVSHPIEKDTIIWFPHLYENKYWNNNISNDGTEITEIKKVNNKEHINNDILNNYDKKIIVFAHVKDSLNTTLYRFKGVFKLDVEETAKQNIAIYKRIGTYIKTYSHQ